MTPSTTATRRRAPLAVLLALIVAATLAVAGCGGDSSTGAGPDTVATYIPAGSPMYFEVSTDIDGPQWTEIQALGKQFPAYPELESSLQDALQGDTVDFETEVRPLLGDRAAVAATSLGDAARVTSGEGAAAAAESASESFLGVVDIADGKRADTEALLTKSGSAASDEYEGASLFTKADDNTVIAVTDEVMLVADTRDQIVAALDAHKAGGDRTLAGTAKFTDTLGKLPQDVLGQMYVDVGAIVQESGEAVPELSQFGLGDIQNGVVGASLIAEPDGLRVKGVVSGMNAYEGLTAFTPGLAANAPADALAYYEVSNVSGAIRSQFETFTAQADPEMAKQIDDFAKMVPQFLGVTVDQIAALGAGQQAFVAVPAPGEEIPGLAILLKVDDGAEAQKTLDAIRGATPQLMQMLGGSQGTAPRWAAVTLPGGTEGWRLRIDDQFGVVYAVDGDLAVIASTPAAASEVLSPASPLADSAEFSEGTTGMPDSVTSVGWLNIEQIAAALESAGAFKDAPPEALANLRPLRSAAHWDTGGDEPTFEVFIRIAG